MNAKNKKQQILKAFLNHIIDSRVPVFQNMVVSKCTMIVNCFRAQQVTLAGMIQSKETGPFTLPAQQIRDNDLSTLSCKSERQYSSYLYSVSPVQTAIGTDFFILSTRLDILEVEGWGS